MKLEKKHTKCYYIGSQRVSSALGTTYQLGLFPVTATNFFSDQTVMEDFREVSNAKVHAATAALSATYSELGQSIALPNPAVEGGVDTLPFDSELYDAYFYHSDHLGSSNYISNNTGIVSQHTEYLPFGESFVDEHLNSHNTPFKFNAKELDDEIRSIRRTPKTNKNHVRQTGNYYYCARYYNPKWSTWLSVDPLAEQTPGWTPYRYGFQNPLKYIDPTGMSEEWVEVDGKIIWDDHITTQEDAELIYGKDAIHRAPGYNYTSKSGNNIELMENRSFKNNGRLCTAPNETSLASLIYSGIKGNGSLYFIQYEARAGYILEGSMALGVAFDTNGNIGTYESFSVGLGLIVGAASSWSVGASTADNINDLSGWGLNAGFVATASAGLGASFAVEYNAPLYFDNHGSYNGFGNGITIGLPIQAGTAGALFGIYGDVSYTFMQNLGSLNEAVNYITSKAK